MGRDPLDLNRTSAAALIPAAKARVVDLRAMVRDASEPGHKADLERRLRTAEQELEMLKRGGSQ
jgi:hypothetical protein